MKAVTTPLTYTTSEGIIADNPAKKFEFFAGKAKNDIECEIHPQLPIAYCSCFYV